MKKKQGLAVLLAAGLAGLSTATAWAAENPFRDVPADHWAYEAVAGLARDGIVEGYGNGNYQGRQPMTRYEMAQVVAKAMAREDQASAADKAAIDKLAAEFSDELTNLGVRVAGLEKKTDNVKWTGALQYTYRSEREYYTDIPSARHNLNEVIFRLEPSMAINAHWTARARVDYRMDLDSSRDCTNHSADENYTAYAAAADVTMDRIWAEGTYGDTLIKLGKLPYKTIADNGLVMEQNISGGQVTFGKNIKTTLTAGRAASDWYDYTYNYTYNYQGLEVYNGRQRRFTWGLGYHHFQADRLPLDGFQYDHTDIYLMSAGLGYRFSPTLALQGGLSWSTLGERYDYWNYRRTSYRLQLDYKRADPNAPHSFGLYAAWARYGDHATRVQNIDNTMIPDGIVWDRGLCGWEVGGSYTLDKNIVGSLAYSSYDTLNHSVGTQYRMLFARVSYLF